MLLSATWYVPSKGLTILVYPSSIQPLLPAIFFNPRLWIYLRNCLLVIQPPRGILGDYSHPFCNLYNYRKCNSSQSSVPFVLYCPDTNRIEIRDFIRATGYYVALSKFPLRFNQKHQSLKSTSLRSDFVHLVPCFSS